MGRRVLLAILIGAFVLSGRTVPAQTPAPPTIETVPPAITELLDTYADAYRLHDESLLRSVVGLGLLDRERRSLAHAEAVPFSSFEVTPVTQYSGNLASQRIKDSYRGEEVATYHVVEKMRVGAESDVYEEDGAYTFLREDGRSERFDGWRLVSKSDLDVLGFHSPYHLWDEDDVSVLRSEHFVLLTHPKVNDVMAPILDAAEKGYARAAAFWPGPQDATYVIIAPATTAELGRIMHETVDLEKFVAFVAAGADRTNGYDPTGPRMFIHLSHLQRYGPDAKVEILAHELIHAITREVSGPLMPTWIEEGLANLGGGSGRTASLAGRGTAPGTFPSNDRFTTGPVLDIQTVYDQAQVAIETLEATHGRPDVAAFYTELGSRRVVAGTDDYHVRDAIAKSVGWSYEAWVDAWRKRLG